MAKKKRLSNIGGGSNGNGILAVFDLKRDGDVKVGDVPIKMKKGKYGIYKDEGKPVVIQPYDKDKRKSTYSKSGNIYSIEANDSANVDIKVGNKNLAKVHYGEDGEPVHGVYYADRDKVIPSPISKVELYGARGIEKQKR